MGEVRAQEGGFWERVYAPRRGEEVAALEEARASVEQGAGLHGAVERLKAAAPAGEGALYYGAVLARSEGRFEDAAGALEGLARRGGLRDVEAFAVWGELAVVRSLLGRYGEALGAWEEALGASRSGAPLEGGTYASILNNMGELWAAQGEEGEAALCYREALRRDPAQVQAMLGLASLAAQRGDLEEASGWALAASLAEPGLGRALGPGAFFVPEGEGALRRGLALEAVGRPGEAALAYREGLLAGGEEGARAVVLKASAERASAAPEGLLGEAPVPLRDPTAVAVGSGGRVAWGDGLGRVLVTRGLGSPELWVLSGPAVVGLAFDRGGQLVVGREDGTVTTLAGAGRATRVVGPLVSSSGTQLLGLSLDGGAALLGRSRGRTWGVVTLERPEVDAGHLKLRLSPQGFALGPLEASRQRVAGAFSVGGGVQVVESDADAGQERRVPVRQASGAGWSEDGRYLVVAGWTEAVVYRAAELSPLRRVEVAGASRAGVLHVVVDASGAAGYGPAVLVVVGDRLRALRWEAP